MTRRSRSSFDLRDALTTAEALSPKPPKVTNELPLGGGKPLVAFGGADPSSVAPPPPAPPPAPVREQAPAAPERRSSLRAAPDVSGITTLIPRLSALLDWLRSDSEVTRALVVDEEGLPLVGATSGDLGDAETLLAATGSVASAMKRLALATPGTLSPDFEGHVGDGPVLQLIGVTADRRAFVVGISRRDPFDPDDVDRVRAAFVAALGGFAVPGARG
jgi:hypothetical protein